MPGGQGTAPARPEGGRHISEWRSRPLSLYGQPEAARAPAVRHYIQI